MSQARRCAARSSRCSRLNPLTYRAIDSSGEELELCGSHMRMLVDMARAQGLEVVDHGVRAALLGGLGTALLILLAFVLAFLVGSGLFALLVPHLGPLHRLTGVA